MKDRCNRCISRRQFLQATGGAIACAGLLSLTESVFAAGPITRTPVFPKGQAKVTVIFSHLPSGTPTWPTKDYDYDARARDLTAKLRTSCPGVQFDFKTAHNTGEADSIIKDPKDADGYIVYLLGIWTWAANSVLATGKPTIIVDDLYAGSGEALAYGGKVHREKLPALVISSSNFQDVADAANLFTTIRALKESTILDVTDADVSGSSGVISKNLGPSVVGMGSKELASYYDAADSREAQDWADFWMKGAKKVVEPTRDEIIKSGRMYLALSKAMTDKKADAVTMDCLGMFYSGRITAYPCLSHFQVNNDGSTGVCESDLNSTCTQLMLRYLTGRPGYVSDPVIDTSKDEIIYAHCVAHSRPFGPGGKANPYIVRSHAEDGKGASIQSLLPLGEMVTTLEVDVSGKRMVIHSGVTAENIDEAKACRTKLAAKTNAQAVLDNWDMGWHRVTVYGDYRKQAINLAKLLGVSVSEEDKA